MSYLDKIVERTRPRVDSLRVQVPIEMLKEQAMARAPTRDFEAAIRSPGISLIAEIKRRSPSAGEIRGNANPSELAVSYQRGGAKALSVLTEPEFFSGSREDLEEARAACDLPVLRKDFVVDPYQVTEARAMGSDAVLLIVAAFEDETLLKEFVAMVHNQGMTALVEIHDESELESALEATPGVIGINQRDLKTFEVDKSLASRIRPSIPDGVTVVAESGIWSREDVRALEGSGIDGVLVGESLMRSDDPAGAVATLLGRAAS